MSHCRFVSRSFVILCIAPCLMVITSIPAFAQKVAGPVKNTTALKNPAHGYPYNAAPMDLARLGYVEEEFFIEGTANRYNTPAGQTGSVMDSGHRYKTRIVVRRPKSASNFNGTVVVEWYNVSQGHDGEYDWLQSSEHILRSGYAWVGVSAQAAGVKPLTEWSPDRYGTLDVTEGGTIMGDTLSYDIFTAAGAAIRGQTNLDVMGGLKPARLIGIGHSQSAGRLYTYFHSIHPLIPKLYDAVVLHGGGGRVRDDLNVRVFKFLNETDVPGQANNRQPDTDRYRQWEVAGTSHLDAQFSRENARLGLRASGMDPVEGSPIINGPSISGGPSGNGVSGNGDGVAGTNACKNISFSRIPSHYVLNAILDHTARWLKDGTPPPAAPPIELKQLPAASAPAQGGRGPQGPRWQVVRDEVGNARGGIQLSQHAVPVATNTGENENAAGGAGGERNCNLMGSYLPFDGARTASLYPTHADYAKKVKEATQKNLKAGYIVKADADATITQAERSGIRIVKGK